VSANIALPKALQLRLQKAASKTRASPESLARRAIAAHLDYQTETLKWGKLIHEAGNIRPNSVLPNASLGS
jgi:predicted transcriptional regulator